MTTVYYDVSDDYGPEDSRFEQCVEYELDQIQADPQMINEAIYDTEHSMERSLDEIADFMVNITTERSLDANHRGQKITQKIAEQLHENLREAWRPYAEQQVRDSLASGKYRK